MNGIFPNLDSAYLMGAIIAILFGILLILDKQDRIINLKQKELKELRKRGMGRNNSI
jgi:hypothetical protein